MSQLSGNSRHQVREPSGRWLTAQEVRLVPGQPSRLYEQSSGVLGFRQTWAAPVLQLEAGIPSPAPRHAPEAWPQLVAEISGEHQP